MTRKEAIEIIEEYADHFEGGASIWEALKAAIDALKNEGALIKKVLEIIDKMPNDNPSYWNERDVVDREGLREEILALKGGAE